MDGRQTTLPPEVGSAILLYLLFSLWPDGPGRVHVEAYFWNDLVSVLII